MKRLKIFFVVFAAIAIMFTVTDAFARRGGSFGFRGFGRGLRSFSSRSFHPSRGYSSRGLGMRGFGCVPIFMPFGGGGGGLFTILFLIAAAYIIFKLLRKKKEGGGGILGGDSQSGVVARLTLAFFATEKTLQNALVDLTKRQPSGDNAQAYMLRETALLLLRHLDAVAKVAFEQHPGMNMTRAESLFEQLTMKMRSSFDQTGLRRDQAGLHEATTPDPGQPASGVSEFVIVSIILAYNEPASILGSISSVDDIRTALQNIASIGSDRLLAMEVVWDPESPDGVLDKEGMDRSYPDLIDV